MIYSQFQDKQLSLLGFDIPGAMKDFAEKLSKLPSWEAICRQREAAAKEGT